jgi:hypothetical protein
MEKLEEINKNLREEIRIYELDSKIIIQQEIDKSNEKYNLLLEEKDKQNLINRELYDKSLGIIDSVTNFKSAKEKGDYGELIFENVCTETFKDFNGYEIKNMSSKGHHGDFHVFFDDFNVLVDAKHYKNKVPITQRVKIINDLKNNSHLHFAWLISLNTKIDKYDRGPVMFQWIEGNKCICYVNELLKQKNPIEFLKSVWFYCKELFRFVITEDYDDDELQITKDKNYKIMEKIKGMKKHLVELKRNIDSSKEIYDLLDNNMRELLNDETPTILENHLNLFKFWWNNNFEESDTKETLKSRDLWAKFKKDNNVENMDINKFKEILCVSMSEENIIKPKKKDGSLEIKNMKMKEIKVLTEKIEKTKKEKNVKSQYFSEEEGE